VGSNKVVQENKEQETWVSKGRLKKIIGYTEAARKIRNKFYREKQVKGEMLYGYIEETNAKIDRDTHAASTLKTKRVSSNQANMLEDTMDRTMGLGNGPSEDNLQIEAWLLPWVGGSSCTTLTSD
jgi:hypothetical protein